ncbi:MAG: DUF4114 domain-containing protein [Leptolyngbya sp. SIO1D8]|nr:DUF4114 domain-containing protein [Leptolyngbya sp. SIO1D8]
MKRHISALGLAAVATTVALAVPGTASASTLSRQATNLLNLDPSSSQYQDSYNSVLGNYDNQAANYGLSFDDWFAINSFVNNERAAYGTNGAKLDDLTALDVNDLTWEAGAHDVEVFFINEGAGYHNKFGYSTSAPTVGGNSGLQNFWNDEVEVIWEDASSQNSILANGGPLSLGQGYQIGDVAAGDTVNFFLRNPHNHVFDSLGAEDTMNGDGLQHVTTYQYGEYLVLAYEDIYRGGDKDYNDVVIAVKGLTDTETADVPEPASALALLGLGAAGVVIRRKRASHA